MNVLSIAHVKTGQHYIVWVIGNYQRLINGNPPMKWVEILEFSKIKPHLNTPASELQYQSETVNFVRMEYPYDHNAHIRKFADTFDKRIYLYRNPYDVLISMFYYFHYHDDLNKEIYGKKDFKNYPYFEDYVKKKIDYYCLHIEKSIDYVDFVLYYDDLLNDTSPFRELLGYFYDEIDESIFQKILELSSFNHVHNLEEEFPKNREKKADDRRFHTRDGRSGQYHELMSIELIDYISKKWEELKLKVKYKLK